MGGAAVQDYHHGERSRAIRAAHIGWDIRPVGTLKLHDAAGGAVGQFLDAAALHVPDASGILGM